MTTTHKVAMGIGAVVIVAAGLLAWRHRSAIRSRAMEAQARVDRWRARTPNATQKAAQEVRKEAQRQSREATAIAADGSPYMTAQIAPVPGIATNQTTSAIQRTAAAASALPTE